jgi:tRNA U34 5-methylaminomethyl-2-thiouridine-forming methyltransferase MnmC
MKKVETKDGSPTLYSEKFGEHYHSLTGAKEEALEKHVKPALEFLNKNGLVDEEVNVLDFCFGLGYNSFVFIEELRRVNKNVRINIVGIDNDIEVVNEGKKIFKDVLDRCIYSDDKVIVSLLIGDAREEIWKIREGPSCGIDPEERIPTSFDVCFFDPFSPKKCPELWSEEVFSEIYKLMKKRGILTTYSCARSARDNMKKAGFEVKDGPIIGRWAPGTIAIKNEKDNKQNI